MFFFKSNLKFCLFWGVNYNVMEVQNTFFICKNEFYRLFVLRLFLFKASFRRSGDVLNGAPHVQKFTWGNLCTCPDLLNEALNQKKCMNEKSIKFIFTHKKGILDFHNVVVNPPKKVKILNCF